MSLIKKINKVREHIRFASIIAHVVLITVIKSYLFKIVGWKCHDLQLKTHWRELSTLFDYFKTVKFKSTVKIIFKKSLKAICQEKCPKNPLLKNVNSAKAFVKKKKWNNEDFSKRSYLKLIQCNSSFYLQGSLGPVCMRTAHFP